MGRILTQSVRTTQPQSLEETHFNRQNFFGAACLWACIPAIGNPSGVTSTVHAGTRPTIDSYPNHALITEATSSPTAGGLFRRTGPGPGGEGPVTAMNFDTGSSNGYRLASTNTVGSDLTGGPRFPDPRSVCAVAIVKPTGAGIGGNDPRILTIDLGTNEVDHTLMLGLRDVDGFIRSRVHVNGNTRTALGSGAARLQPDAWNVLSGGLETRAAGGGSYFIYVHVLHEDDSDYRAIHSSGINLNDDFEYAASNHKLAIGGSAIVGDNPFDGEVLICYYFDGRKFRANINAQSQHAEVLRRLRANPWQVFEPETTPSFYPSPISTVRKMIQVPR